MSIMFVRGMSENPTLSACAASAAGRAKITQVLDKCLIGKDRYAMPASHYRSRNLWFSTGSRPSSGAMVSAYKIGYSTVGRTVLLALYGSRALDMTSKHASYHYVSIEGDVSAHSGYLLLSLTEDEFERVKQITRVHPSRRTGLFWWHFPMQAMLSSQHQPVGRGQVLIELAIEPCHQAAVRRSPLWRAFAPDTATIPA